MDLLVDHGDVIPYVLAGVLALLGLGMIQLVRRRRDVRKARDAVRLVTYSIAAPRPGPVAVKGVWRAEHIDCSGERVTIDGACDVQRGTKGRWKNGVRTYSLREGDAVYAIGVMSKRGDHAWSIAASPGEDGVQVYAATPRPVPKPLWPWRAPFIVATCGAIAFFGLYEVGTQLVAAPADCQQSSEQRLEISSAMPLVRDDALAALARCKR